MKSFVVLVFVVGTALCVPDPRTRRDILPGDPRYGTDYHHHHHQGSSDNGGSDSIQVVKSIGNYAGTIYGSGSAPGRIPAAVYGPPNYQPGTPIGQQTHQVTTSQQYQPQYQPAPQKRPAIPAATYGIPVRPGQQTQHQQHYTQHVHQSSYHVPESRPAPSQSYGPPAQQQSAPVKQVQHLPASRPNNAYITPVVEQSPSASYGPPVVQYQPQQQHPQQQQVHYQVQHIQSKPHVTHVDYQHHVQQPQPQPQTQYVHIQHREPQRPVQHVHQTQQIQNVQHEHHQKHQEHQQQVQQMVHHVHVQQPINSYGVPIAQAQQTAPAREYIPQNIQAQSAPAPTAQRQVDFNVLHDEHATPNSPPSIPFIENINLQNFQMNPFVSAIPTQGFPNFPEGIPFVGGSGGGSPSFPGVQNLQSFGFDPSSFSPPSIPGIPFPWGGMSSGGTSTSGSTSSTTANTSGGSGATDSSTSTSSSTGGSEGGSSSSSSAAASEGSSFRTLPIFEVQSGSAGSYNNVGSSHTSNSGSASSGYPKEQPQPSLQYISPVQKEISAPTAESVVVDSIQQQEETVHQHQEPTQPVDSNGGYIY